MKMTLLRAVLAAGLLGPVAAMAQTPVGGTVVNGAPPAPNLNSTAPLTVDQATGGLRILCVSGCSGAGGGGSGTVAGSMEQDVRATNTLNAATTNATVAYAINGQATVGFTFAGLTASGATLTYEQSIDGGTTWTGINAVNRGTGVPEATRTTDGQIALSATGRTNIRVRISTPGTGTITVVANVSVREGIFSLGSPLPPGTNVVGAVLPPTAAAGKIARTVTTLAANTSTTIAAARATPGDRLAFSLQCGSGGVAVDETGSALTGATVGNGTLFVPANPGAYFTPPIATQTAITAFTATAQTCVVTEYLR